MECYLFILKVTRTPPDIKRKREKEELIKKGEEIAKLVLTPFGEQPVISFENIKLGQSAVRTLAIQNPTAKPIKVSTGNLGAFLLWQNPYI